MIQLRCIGLFRRPAHVCRRGQQQDTQYSGGPAGGAEALVRPGADSHVRLRCSGPGNRAGYAGYSAPCQVLPPLHAPHEATGTPSLMPPNSCAVKLITKLCYINTNISFYERYSYVNVLWDCSEGPLTPGSEDSPL